MDGPGPLLGQNSGLSMVVLGSKNEDDLLIPDKPMVGAQPEGAVKPRPKPSLTWRVWKRAISKFFSDHGTFMASGLSFDLLLYCLPMPLLLVSGFGYTMVGSDRALRWVQEGVKRLLPGLQEPFIQALSSIMANRNLLGVTAFLLFFLFSSAVFSSIRVVLNNVFMVKDPQPFLKGKGTDFLTMGLMSLMLFLAAALASVMTVFQTLGASVPLLEELLSPFWLVFGKVLGMIFIGTLFYLLYWVSTPAKLSSMALLIGSVTGAGLFQISKIAFLWYVSVADVVTTLYGALSSLIFFFIWIYYASTVFIFGAEITWAYDELQKKEKDDSVVIGRLTKQ